LIFVANCLLLGYFFARSTWQEGCAL